MGSASERTGNCDAAARHSGEMERVKALEKLPAKDIDRAQSAPQKALMCIFVPVKAPTLILTTTVVTNERPHQ